MKAVVFDLGGVLIDWRPEALFRKIFGSEAEMTAFLDTVCTQAWNEKQDAGRSVAEGVAKLSRRHPEHADAIRAYYARFDEMLVGPIEGSVLLLKRLHRQGRHRLLALSNWSAETFPCARKRFVFLELFEDIFVSGQEGVIKPDPEIFLRFLGRYGLQAGDCFFIDDNPRNTQAAEDLGMRTCLFREPEDLERVLVNLGLLTS